ncbi:MAG: hypothetical protein AMXMBFR7_21540 [Planctomycetota bacterium]
MSDGARDGGLEGRLIVEAVREEDRVEKQDADCAGKPGDDEGDGALEALKEWVGLLVRAGFWALLIYLCVFQVSVVKGDSMQPGYHPGDRLLIDKLTYRWRDPHLGDVVIFETVMETGGRWVHRDFIKRVVAGPGDTVELYDEQVWVNGRALVQDWEIENVRPGDREAQPKGPLTERYRVPPERFFVLGDRRWNSRDSRYPEIGYVSRRQIKGKVRWRFWPPERWSWE